MSASRDKVLAAVRQATRAAARSREDEGALQARLDGHPRGLVPKRGEVGYGARLDLFEAQVTALSATLTRIRSREEIPAALGSYLRQQNLPPKVKMAPNAELEALPWDREPLLEIETGIAEDADAVSFTASFGGVAETGTLVLHSGPQSPSTLNFLPETHVVLLKGSAVAGCYEEIWDRLRAAFGAGALPRTVNMITGPSRTGDIEQTIQLGAHGPRRLHVILLDDGEPGG